MFTFIVTVKLPRNPAHDPRNKVTGPCPINSHRTCTDVTGEHHSYVDFGPNLEAVRAKAEEQHGHVTRIEQTLDPEDY